MAATNKLKQVATGYYFLPLLQLPMNLKSKLSTLALVTPLLFAATAWAQGTAVEEAAAASSEVVGAAPSKKADTAELTPSQQWSVRATQIVQAALATTGQYPRIYLAPPANATPFETSLHRHMLARLTDSGAFVQTKSGLGVSTLTVVTSMLPVYASGVSYIHQVADIGRHWVGLPVVSRAEGMAVDSVEVMVTASLEESGAFLFNQTEMFTVSPDQLSSYRAPPRTLVIVGDPKPVTAP
jgi:hypothetical protein